LQEPRTSCRAWVVASVHSAGPARHDYIFYFKKTYIHIYNLYSILKTFEHDVLLVRQLHPVSPALLLSIRGWFRIPPLAPFFNILHWFNQMSRRANGMVRHSQQAGMTCLGQSALLLSIRGWFRTPPLAPFF
jgi:hypothetical protein